MDFKSLTVEPTYLIFKEHIIFDPQPRHSSAISRFYENDIYYITLNEAVDDLRQLMAQYDLTFNEVVYQSLFFYSTHDHFSFQFKACEINTCHYNNGIIRLYSGDMNCRYMSISNIPSLLFVLLLIRRILQYK